MSKYHSKYNKYKYKYIRLKQQLKEMNYLNGSLEDSLDDSLEDPNDIETMKFLNRGINRAIDLDIKDEPDNVGESKDIRTLTAKNGVEVFYTEMNPSEIRNIEITKELKHDSSSVLVIDNVELFDKFTDKYANVYDDQLWIDWEKLQASFLGIYIKGNDEFRLKRLLEAPKDGKTYKSWWGNELDLDYVVYFDRTDNQIA